MPCGHNKFGLSITLDNKMQTIGNALRKILDINIEGYIVISIGINGFCDELVKMDGIKEDVIEVINNVKQLEFMCHDGRRVFKVIINTSKIGNFLTRHILLPNGLSILNPNQYICNLGIGTRLRLELVVVYGIGYLTASEV